MKVSFNIQGPNGRPFYNNSSTYWYMNAVEMRTQVHLECKKVSEMIRTADRAPDLEVRYSVRITWDGNSPELSGDRSANDLAYATVLEIQGEAIAAMERLRQLGIAEVQAGVRI